MKPAHITCFSTDVKMSSSHAGFVALLKRSSSIMRLRRTAITEIIAESLDRSLPVGYRLMRLVTRSNVLRHMARSYYSHRVPVAYSTDQETMFTGLSVSKAVRDLNEKGFADGIALPRPFIKGILSFCAEAQFVDDFSNEPLSIDLQDDRIPHPDRLAYRCRNPHTHCYHVAQLARDPAIVEVAVGYLKAQPVFRSTRIFWSYPDYSEGYNPLYGFHYDIDDYKFLKLFFYLCDVDNSCGPHVIIEGSHKKKDWYEKAHRRLRDDQAERRYGQRIRVITGAAGQGFFEDTFCYHKGSKPQKRRLMLELEFSISTNACA